MSNLSLGFYVQYFLLSVNNWYSVIYAIRCISTWINAWMSELVFNVLLDTYWLISETIFLVPVLKTISAQKRKNELNGGVYLRSNCKLFINRLYSSVYNDFIINIFPVTDSSNSASQQVWMFTIPRPISTWLLCDTYSCPAVFVKTCVALKFVDDDDDDDDKALVYQISAKSGNVLQSYSDLSTCLGPFSGTPSPRWISQSSVARNVPNLGWHGPLFKRFVFDFRYVL